MKGFDPRASFGFEESQRYDATGTRGDEERRSPFLLGWQASGMRWSWPWAPAASRCR